MKLPLWGEVKSYRARRAALHPFLTLAGMKMTGDSLLGYLHTSEAEFASHLTGLHPDIVELYRKIISGFEGIGNNYLKKLIPSEFSAEIRSLLCHYFKDANDFHIRGLSGLEQVELRRDYQRVAERLEDLQTRITSGANR